MSLRGLLCCEVTKTKRDNILLAGLAAVLLSVGYSTFQMYLGMSVGERMYFDLLSYVVVFNNTTLVLPATLALVGGHVIDREYGAGTLKSILTIPVPFQRLLVAKLLAGGLVSLLFGITSFTLTLASGTLLLRLDGVTVDGICLACWQICGMSLLCYLAVTPVIVLATRRRGLYTVGAGVAFLLSLTCLFVGSSSVSDVFPITAGYALVGYAAASETAAPLTSLAVFAGVLAITAALVRHSPSYDSLVATSARGWASRKAKIGRRGSVCELGPRP